MRAITAVCHSAYQVTSLEKRMELYDKCVHALGKIIESGSMLNDVCLAQQIGYNPRQAHLINFVWRTNPKLRDIIASYQRVMSAKYEAQIRSRIAARQRKNAEAKRLLKEKKAREKLTEVDVINAAVSLYEQGKKVTIICLAEELEKSRGQICDFLYYNNELKEEIGLSYGYGNKGWE